MGFRVKVWGAARVGSYCVFAGSRISIVISSCLSSWITKEGSPCVKLPEHLLTNSSCTASQSSCPVRKTGWNAGRCMGQHVPTSSALMLTVFCKGFDCRVERTRLGFRPRLLHSWIEPQCLCLTRGHGCCSTRALQGSSPDCRCRTIVQGVLLKTGTTVDPSRLRYLFNRVCACVCVCRGVNVSVSVCLYVCV